MLKSTDNNNKMKLSKEKKVGHPKHTISPPCKFNLLGLLNSVEPMDNKYQKCFVFQLYRPIALKNSYSLFRYRLKAKQMLIDDNRVPRTCTIQMHGFRSI